MAVQGGHGRKKGKPPKQVRRPSQDSNSQTNMIFFSAPLPAYNASQTWKSEQAKEREHFERKKNLVKHIAPEQFRDPAKPTNEACDIFPRTYIAWVNHQAEMKSMAIATMMNNIQIKEAHRKAGPDARIPLKLAFGKKGKQMKYINLSTVLAQPTVFTPDYEPTDDRPQAPWPCHAELHWDGDNRENFNAKTRCGRFLPDLRDPTNASLSYAQRPRITQLPLDQTAITHHLFGFGQAPFVYNEANAVMDNDHQFEAAGRFYLGEDLMKEIGEYQEPFIPEWQAKQHERRYTKQLSAMYAHRTPLRIEYSLEGRLQVSQHTWWARDDSTMQAKAS